MKVIYKMKNQAEKMFRNVEEHLLKTKNALEKSGRHVRLSRTSLSKSRRRQKKLWNQMDKSLEVLSQIEKMLR